MESEEKKLVQLSPLLKSTLEKIENIADAPAQERKWVLHDYSKKLAKALNELQEYSKEFSKIKEVVDDELKILHHCDPLSHSNNHKRSSYLDADRERTLGNIPEELQVMIFSHLDLHTLIQISAVCKYWKKISRDDIIWKRRVEDRWGDGENGIDSSWWRSVMPPRPLGTSWYKYYIEQDFLRTTRNIKINDVIFGDFIIQKTHYKIFKGIYRGHVVQLLVPKDTDKYRNVVNYWKTLKHKNLLPLLAICDMTNPKNQVSNQSSTLNNSDDDHPGSASNRTPTPTKRTSRQSLGSNGNSIISMQANKNDFSFFLVSPYYSKSLEEILKSQPFNPIRIDSRKLVKMALDIAEALLYLHTQEPKPLLFQDLKPPKILIGDTDELILGDFTYIDDIASVHTRGFSTGRARGSPLWMAPEKLSRRHNIDEKSDIFSFALVLWQLLPNSIGLEPDEDLKSFNDLVDRRVAKGERPSLPSDLGDNKVLQGVMDLIKKCWEHEKVNRPTSAVIAEKLHECLHMIDASDKAKKPKADKGKKEEKREKRRSAKETKKHSGNQKKMTNRRSKKKSKD